MIARTHDAAALTGLIMAVVLFAPELPQLSLATMMVAFLANQAGGIAPDIDQPTAPLWRNLPIGGVFGRAIGRMLGGHRFLTHSLVGLALAGWLFNLLLHFLHPIMPHVQIDIVWWSFMIGMISHLIMDSFTKEGVPWLLPIPIKFGFPPLRKFRMTTGKWIEKYIVFPLLLLALVALCSYFYNVLYELFQNRLIN